MTGTDEVAAAVAAGDAGDWLRAKALCEQVLARNPDDAAAHWQLTVALVRLGQREAALRQLYEVVRADPIHYDALISLGSALTERGQVGEGAPLIERAVAARPAVAQARHTLAGNYMRQKRWADAAAQLEAALRLEPGFVDAMVNLAAVRRYQERPAEAVDLLERALAVRPGMPEAAYNLGAIRMEQNDIASALVYLDVAIRALPEHPDVRMSRANCYLLRGDLEVGFREYEWRWKLPDSFWRKFDRPEWDGRALGGRPILLHSEQGLGDTLMMARYARVVAARGGRVIVECQPGLRGVLASCPGIAALVARGDPLPEHAVQAALMSLPRIVGTTLDLIPSPGPYLFADARRVERWRAALARGPGPSVAIAWQGSRRNPRDPRRSVPLALFAPLARAGARLVSVQVGDGSEQIAQLAGAFGLVAPPRAADPVEAWLETAAILTAVDLVVSVDSAVAHLAGALGVPVWMAIPFHPDWRWMLERSDSPWYPSMRIFRQRRPGDWDDVFARIAEALASAPRSGG